MSKTFLEIVNFILPAGSTHQSTDWQVDDDINFTAPILIDDVGNTIDLLEVTKIHNITGQYFSRARINLDTGPLGYISPIGFSNPNILTPDVIFNDSEYNTLTPTISISPFISLDGSSYLSTDWIIVDINTKSTVFESIGDTANIDTLIISNGLLLQDSRYRIYVRYQSTTGYSGYGMLEFTVNCTNGVEIVNTTSIILTIPGTPNNVIPLPTLSTTPTNITGHTETDWEIEDVLLNKIVFQSLSNNVNLNSISLSIPLMSNRQYVARARHKINNLHTDYDYVNFTIQSSVNNWYQVNNNNIVNGSISSLLDNRAMTIVNTIVSIYDPATDTWTPAANYPIDVLHHSQSTLSDGRVLGVGGLNNFSYSNNCYIYDPATDTWTAVANYPFNITRHTQSTLNDGRVLVVGGELSGPNIVNTCNIYDPATDTWTPAANYPIALRNHSQSTLLDGRVLVVGGDDSNGSNVNVCYIYDPATDTWTPAANYPITINYHTQSTLSDGRVLVVGGLTSTIDQCYIYDPATDTWTPAANYPIALRDHAQTTLLDGRVLVVGGYSSNIGNVINCYLYIP